jgi:hypothetical protein
MDRRHRPFWALFTAFALIVGTILPDRTTTREPGTPIVENDAISTTAIPAFWTFSFHTVQRVNSSRHSGALQPWIASRFPTFAPAASVTSFEDETRSLPARDAYAFTYDATAPPSIVVL